MSTQPTEHDETQLKYQRVYQELEREITSGAYRPGQKLPSEAALVQRFGASRITVGRAVRDLQQAGLVERRAGSGTYVRTPQRETTEAGFSFGLLIPDLGRTEIFEPICQGMADAPQARDHVLLWGNAMSREAGAPRQEQAWQLCQQYIARSVSGVFFAPLECLEPDDRINHRIVEALENAGIPVVLLDRDFLAYPRRSQHDLVGIDNRRTGFIATEHLIKLGCRRIAFLSIPRSPATVEERAAGYREALFMHGVTVEPQLILHSSIEEERERVREIMETLRPDGFVCANDRIAGVLMHALLALGVRIPGDARIVGIDDITYASLLPVPLTTVHQPCREIGMAAMVTMLDRIHRPDMTVRDVLIQTRLVIRDSCGSRPLSTAE